MKTKEEIEQLGKQSAQKKYRLQHIPLEQIDEYGGEIKDYVTIFIQGYTQCQEDITDKWFEYPKNIPPIHSENYLIVDNGYIQISLFRGDYNKFQHELIGAEKCNITHWMSLPNKPLNKGD